MQQNSTDSKGQDEFIKKLNIIVKKKIPIGCYQHLVSMFKRHLQFLVMAKSSQLSSLKKIYHIQYLTATQFFMTKIIVPKIYQPA